MDTALFRRNALDARRQGDAGAPIEPDPLGAEALVVAALAVLCTAAALVTQVEVARRVTVKGYLTPQVGVARVRVPAAGIVTEALVEEGDQVVAGQPLMRIESRRATGAEPDVPAATERDYAALRADLLTQRELNLRVRDAELGELDRRAGALALEREVLIAKARTSGQRAALAERRLRELAPAVAAGHLPRAQELQQADRVAELQVERLGIEQQVLDRSAQSEAIAADRQAIALRAAIRLAELDAALSRLAIEQRAAIMPHDALISAPIDGTVLRLAARAGAPLQSGQVAVALAPTDAPLQAVMLVPSRHAGMVETGQPVVMRLDAFPYQRFGVLRAVVAGVGGSVMLPGESETPVPIGEPMFEANAKLGATSLEAYGRRWALHTDLTFEADIVLERRTLLERLLDPLRAMTRRGG